MGLISYIGSTFRPAPNSIPSFHGLRVIGFLWVTCIHILIMADFPLSEKDLSRIREFRSFNPLGLIYGSGTYGVEIFFVLSGYLLAQQLYYQFITHGKIDIIRTLVSRLFRLYPVLLCLQLFYQKINPGCPSKRELLMMGMDFPGCPGLLWSTFVDFQTWVILVPIYALLCAWISSQTSKQPAETKVQQLQRSSIKLGMVLFVIWVIFRAAVVIHEDPILTVETTSKHLNPPTTANLMKTMPHLKWEVEVNSQLWEEAQEIKFFLWHVYSNPFAKFGALTTGFLVYFLTYSSDKKEPTTFQKTLFKYQVPLTILSILCLIPLLAIHTCPANHWLVSLSHSNKLLFLIIQRPLFVLIFCYYFTLILSHHLPGCPWHAKLVNQFLSLPIFFPIAKISYCTYAWNLVGIAVASLVIFPLTSYYLDHLVAYYLRVLVVAVLVLVPIGAITHLLIEQPGIKLHAYLFAKPHAKHA